MSQLRKVVCVIGTRPEAIKMAPVVAALRTCGWAHCVVMVTAQHRMLLDRALADFGIVPDIDLNLMQENQTLAALTSRSIERIDQVLVDLEPDFVVAQGDTTTVLATGLCCFYRNIPFGHVEAGLRTYQRRLPFPEEMNRVFASFLAALHFAPTEAARQHLLAEGVPATSIYLTGNTVIDALHYQMARTEDVALPLSPDLRTVLVTAHRRESFGEPMREICAAIRELVERHAGIQVLLPVHPNPNVGSQLRAELSASERVVLAEALDYRHFVAAMQRSYLILTDSGGVQEEAPALGKPVLVMREHSERPEAVQAGVAQLVGNNRARIVAAASRLLTDPSAYAAMARGVSPYGDGHSASRIVNAIRDLLLGESKL